MDENLEAEGVVMKRFLLSFLIVFVLLPVYAQEVEILDTDTQETQSAREVKTEAPKTELRKIESGFYLNGGVSTGILIKHTDTGGNLGTIAGPSVNSLHFATYNNYARSGVGWLNANGEWTVEDVGRFGAQVGMWAHGDINNTDNTIRMGDHFVWGNFFKDQMRVIVGQGGGTPISSGGWIGADWLSYAGLRVFGVFPFGLSVGLKLPDPGEEGITPVNYLTMLGAGISFGQGNWFITLQFDNRPVYDDSETSYYGGLLRPAEQEPIGIAGNAAVSFGINNLYAGKGNFVFEALITNLGEDNIDGYDDYTYSPIAAAFALKTGFPIGNQVYFELKGKGTINQGDSYDLTYAEYWGKVEVEPYISFKPLNHLTFDLSAYLAYYINSYYLAYNYSGLYKFESGQVPGYDPLLDYLSPYQLTIKPRVIFNIPGVELLFGYTGSFSRDHVDNTIYLDFRWSF